MAGQGIERRDALRFIGIASVAATFPGFSRWTFACAHNEQQAAAAATQSYKLQFFTPDQFRLGDSVMNLLVSSENLCSSFPSSGLAAFPAWR